MIISGGWFKGKNAELKREPTVDRVRIYEEGFELDFIMQNGKLYTSVENVGHVEEFRRIYDQLSHKS